jgi:hypothetical protein
MMKEMLRPRNARMWPATVGLTEQQFNQLLVLFTRSYEAEFGRSLEQRIADSLKEVTFKTAESLLMFTLFSLKSGLAYDALGYVYQLDGANAKRNQALGLRVLTRTLQDAKMMPVREFKTPQALYEHFKKEAVVLLDGTEQRIQRPGDKEEQKEWYSGKKSSYHPGVHLEFFRQKD